MSLPDPTVTAASLLADAGFAVWPHLVPAALIDRLRQRADTLYARVERWLDPRPPTATPTPLPPGLCAPDGPDGVTYVPTADSLGLAALGPLAGELWARAEAALGPVFAAELGPGVPTRRLEAHAWLRRQHPPGARRPPRCPHGWHQDGGLGFDYLTGDVADGLLPMITAWIPLTACGRDAPGLRLDPTRRAALLALDRLADAAAEVTTRARTPQLGPGEAVVMHGGTLHATAAVGDRPRISVELRWLPADRALRV